MRLWWCGLALTLVGAGCQIDGSATVKETQETDSVLGKVFSKIPGVFKGNPKKPKPPKPVQELVHITGSRIIDANTLRLYTDKTITTSLAATPGLRVEGLAATALVASASAYADATVLPTLHRTVEQYIVSQDILLNATQKIPAGQTGPVDGPYIVSITQVGDGTAKQYDVVFSEAINHSGTFDPSLVIDSEAYDSIGAWSNGDKTVRMTYPSNSAGGLSWQYSASANVTPAAAGWFDDQSGTTIASGATPPSTDVIYVDFDNGDDDTGDGSFANPYKTAQKGADVAQASVAGSTSGVTVYFRVGTYTALENVGFNWRAIMKLTTGGSSGKPILFKNYNGEEVIFDCGATNTPTNDSGVMYGILLGNYQGDYVLSNIGYVTIDGIKVTYPGRQGILMSGVNHCTVQNCAVSYGAQYGDVYEGIGFVGVCDTCTVQYNRCYGCGNGIAAVEDDITSSTPHGIVNCTIKDNICYGNYPVKGNAGNAAGIGFRFPEKCLIEGNIVYDNPDGGLNCLGSMCCRYIGNASIENWNGSMTDGSNGGNMQGFKPNVRGGGGNIVCGNLIVANGTTGMENDKGPGDLYINNTVYGNGTQGLAYDVAYGSGQVGTTLTINTISSWNGVDTSQGLSDTPDRRGLDSDLTDYNLYGPLRPNYSSTLSLIQRELHAHEKIVDAGLVNPQITGHTRSTLRQIQHPEDIWGGSNLTAAQIRALLAAQFAPTHSFARDTGLAQASIVTLANGATHQAAVINALDLGLAYPAVSQQELQALTCYTRVKAYLIADSGYEDLSDYLNDLLGNPIGATPDMGCCPALAVGSFLNVKPAGTHELIWTFDRAITGLGTFINSGDGWHGLLADLGAGLVAPTQYDNEGDSHNIRVTYSNPTSAGIAWQYRTGAVVFANGDVPDTTSGVVDDYGAQAVPVGTTEDQFTFNWKFRDEDGAYPIYATGPSDFTAFSAAIAGLQISPEDGVWQSGTYVFGVGAYGIDVVYDTQTAEGRPWRTISPAHTLVFENGQVLDDGQTGATGLPQVTAAPTRLSATRARWDFSAGLAADYITVGAYSGFLIDGAAPTAYVSGGQAGDTSVTLDYSAVAVDDEYFVPYGALSFYR